MTRLLLAALLLSGCQAMTLDLSPRAFFAFSAKKPVEFEVTVIRIPF